MSEIHNTRCELTREIEKAAIGARNKAAADWDSPLAPIYSQVALELRRILARHAKQCPICLEEAGRCDAEMDLATTPRYSTFGVRR